MRTSLGCALTLIAVSLAAAGPADKEVLRVANAMLGSFDNRAQADPDRAGGSTDVLLMTARPIQDPVVFQDGLYVYVEHRVWGEPRPYRQRIYRLTKRGRKIRLELFKIDAGLLGPLALEPQMLNSLAPGDLTKEEGCDILLEAKGGDYAGSTRLRSCKSSEQGSAYETSAIRVGKDVVVTLDRGYDGDGIQTFGPTDGRGHEFRRTTP